MTLGDPKCMTPEDPISMTLEDLLPPISMTLEDPNPHLYAPGGPPTV